MEGDGSRLADTHQHNEILANKTILTLNLKQVARSRRSAQRGAGRREEKESRHRAGRQQPQKYQPQIQNRIYYTYIPMGGLPPACACVCQIFILRIGSQDLLISMRTGSRSKCC